MNVFGAYTLERRLGAGGMGEVFLAHRAGDARPVVLKRVLPHLAARPGFVERFLHEVRVLARLDDPHVVKVYDFGEHEGRWFVVMEYVEGVDVARLRGQGPLPVAQVCRVALDAADALLAAHEARDASGRATPIIHRDVSPENLIMGADGGVKLIDFGVASLTGQGESGGKIAYAAPEQLLDDATSPQSDQYSLGVVLWEALAGRAAFDAETDVELLRQVTEVGVPPLPAPVPAVLRELVARMTALDPGSRWPGLREVREAVAATRLAAPVVRAAPVRRDAGPSQGRLRAVLTREEEAALAALGEGMTSDEAEQAIDAAALPGMPFALDLLQALLEKGALVTVETNGVLRFHRQSA